ncbi:ABC transporter ATP-binding protein [Desulfuromonas carbonis]|uniref:ABC transporter ATP-binding protein n=1 Tax=Desulfuromonas sp. DDH964 TaxID=1823759 RepID=UPI00078CBCFF|nr:ABC transporter ATP-binding protein [Desulfuromonas sp. DDH964]AMV72811.1 ABC transporter ATP-binding protein [Desulfuromonas sp. DDH964]
MPLIELNDLTRIYPVGNRTVTALAGLTLTIAAGEFTVLAGPSGSGKTTALNLIGALDAPTRGSVTIAGRNLGGESPKALAEFRLHQVGFIFQSYNLIPVLTAAENAEFTLMLQGVPKRERRRKVSALFAELGIAGLEERRPGDLSGGQQQRVAVARAIISQPAVVLADEPTANLDSHTSEELLRLMRNLNTEHGTTFIFSSHDPQVIALARRVVRLRDGQLESDSVGAR